MPELFMTLDAYHDRVFAEQKFHAAIHDRPFEETEDDKPSPPTWEDIQARVHSGGKAKDSKDILGLVGPSATKAGIGIGQGLNYVDENSKTEWWKDL